MSNYRIQRDYENLQKYVFEGEGEFGIPRIEPTQFDGCDQWIPFNQAKNCKNPSVRGVHFFIDDYQFNRLWTNIDRYVSLLSGFQYVMSPDFSTYIDFPKAIQIYNHYRKHWIGAYLQLLGIDVIPTISWSTPDSFEWCFDGEPEGATVAVSSVGCMNSTERKNMFLDGYKAMVSRLRPETIIFYGLVPEECLGNIVKIKIFQEKFTEARCDGWQRIL